MNKKTRLAKILDKESYSDIIRLYCCAKTNSQISREDFIIFKSFLAKMIDAQTEKWLGTKSRWQTPHEFFQCMLETRTEIEVIEFITKYIKYNIKLFGFDLKKDYGFVI